MISDWTEVAETFDSMGLHENLLRGIYAYGPLPWRLSIVTAAVFLRAGTAFGSLRLMTDLEPCRFREAVRDPAARNRSFLPWL